MATSLPSEVSSAVAVEPRAFVSNALSTFRTKHSFDHYGSFSSPEEFIAYRAWARERRLPLVAPVRESVFTSRRARGASRLSRALPRQLLLPGIGAGVGWWRARDECRPRPQVQPDNLRLRRIGDRAGRPDARDARAFRSRVEIPLDAFLNRPETLVLGATFHFPPTELESDPVAERMRYCKDVQDPVAPNCGSAFSHYDLQTMERLGGLTMFGASISDKTTNWILNRSESSLGIRSLLMIARALHAIRRRAYRVEYVCIK